MRCVPLPPWSSEPPGDARDSPPSGHAWSSTAPRHRRHAHRARQAAQRNHKGAELALWHLDQRIDDRGVAIECAQPGGHRILGIFPERLSRSIPRADRRSGRALREACATSCWSSSCSSTAWACPTRRCPPSRGPSPIPTCPASRELLGIRLQASRTSTAKTLANGTYKFTSFGAPVRARPASAAARPRA